MRDKILDFVKTGAYKPMRAEDLAAELKLKGEELNAFFRELSFLEKEALLYKNRSGLIGLPAQMNLVVGRLSLTQKGYGFIVPDDKENGADDVFVPSGGVFSAMHGDRVIARVAPSEFPGRSLEGEIIRIVERANQKIVGTFDKSTAFGFVKPDNPRLGYDVFIAKKDFNGAQIGTKVVCEITKWPDNRRNLEGKIIEALGKFGEPGVDVLSVMRSYDLNEEFPAEVQAEANALPDKVEASDLEGRRDRRSFKVVTIDGDDAKDFDDAVYAEKRDGGYFLGVYIADVSRYVKEKSPLDKEARERATSVYIVDRVIPMLPFELSNGICSLNEGVDRLATACEMELDENGQIIGYELFSAVIKSHRRLTYNLVNKILVEGEKDFIADNEDIVPMLKTLAEIRDKRKRIRHERGSIDFSLPEIKVTLDEKGRPTGITKRLGSLSESIIEECMLAANETVAMHIAKKALPFVYRVHEEPSEKKIEGLNEVLTPLGMTLRRPKDGKIKPKMIQSIVEKVKGKAEENLVSKVALRSMMQARYATNNDGHFGLAAEYYTHFTSPIRRYPDLIVHRILKETFESGTLSEKRQKMLRSILPEIAEHSSAQERVAQEAERETTAMKAVEYMAQFVGETFPGVISGVTAFGIFVELETGVEGLAHVSRMVNDFYSYNEAELSLTGNRTGEKYRLGDAVEVVLIRADVETRELDLIVKGNGIAEIDDEKTKAAKKDAKKRYKEEKKADKSEKKKPANKAKHSIDDMLTKLTKRAKKKKKMKKPVAKDKRAAKREKKLSYKKRG